MFLVKDSLRIKCLHVRTNKALLCSQLSDIVCRLGRQNARLPLGGKCLSILGDLNFPLPVALIIGCWAITILLYTRYDRARVFVSWLGKGKSRHYLNEFALFVNSKRQRAHNFTCRKLHSPKSELEGKLGPPIYNNLMGKNLV